MNMIQDVGEAFEIATHEAKTAFGNGDLFLEKFLGKPRHIEVQVLGKWLSHLLVFHRYRTVNTHTTNSKEYRNI